MAEKNDLSRVPLEVGNMVLIRSMENQELKAKSRVIGFSEGEYIIIEEPVIASAPEPATVMDGKVLCCYVDQGDFYYFYSNMRSKLGEGLVKIDYPDQFQLKSLRKHQRIQVKLDTRVFLRKFQQPATGFMKNISEKGCLLEVRSFREIEANMQCELEFTLPNGDLVEKLQGTIRNVKMLDEFTSEVGVEFVGPLEEIGKVFFFCQLCKAIQVGG